MRLHAGALATLALAALVTPSVPVGAQTTTTDAVAEADAAIARLRQEADTLAGAYFVAVGRLAEVQVHIDVIESRIPELTDRVAELRARTRERAVVAYRRAGNDLASVITAGDPLDAARRVRWLGHLNAVDEALAADLRATTARLDAQRAELEQARGAAAAALDGVRAQGEQIDALLAGAEARRRAAATPPTTATATGPAAAALAPDPAPTPTVARAAAPTVTTQAKAPAVPTAAPPSYTPRSGTHPHHDDPFLVCTRTREASGNYAAVNPAGPYMGAYQFLQATWNSAANHAGRSDLIGVPPHTASPYDQDDVAWTLYKWQGSRPWGDLCTNP